MTKAKYCSNVARPTLRKRALFMFGLGHALPVIFLSTLLATARRVASDKITSAGEWLTKILGLVFLIIGIVITAYALGGW